MTKPKFPLGRGGWQSLQFREARASVSSDRLTLAIFIFSLLSVLGQASFILVSLGKLPPQVPIFYSRPWGEPMLARPISLWILPAIATFVFILNFYFFQFFFKNNRFILRILFVFSFVVALFTLYDIAKIISLLT